MNHFSNLLLVILVIFMIGALPKWPHSKNWGYYPSGGLIIVIFIVWLAARQT
jgi:hypothetical protein